MYQHSLESTPGVEAERATALMDVILPCLNEAQALPLVLAGLPAGCHAIVVDNGSTDGSPEIAAALGATIVHEPRRGYGAACHAGLLAATADVVAFADADATLDLAQLTGMTAPVTEARADLVLGRRDRTAAMAWHARLANRTLAAYLRHNTPASVHDIAPMRVARREPLLSLGIIDRRSGYPLETLLRAARAGWRIEEVPVTYGQRIGRSKVTGTVRGTLTAVHDMTAVLRADRTQS